MRRRARRRGGSSDRQAVRRPCGEEARASGPTVFQSFAVAPENVEDLGSIVVW